MAQKVGKFWNFLKVPEAFGCRLDFRDVGHGLKGGCKFWKNFEKFEKFQNS